jgi:uncharacterized cysteine cluster protein YcgN (CxxCxxCC family)
MTEQPFWQTKTLSEMTDAEWESLCDGCGKCCLVKLQDEDTGTILHTDVGCYLLDTKTCRCRRYRDRQRLVPDCIKVTPANIGDLAFMPSTCAYRLVARGEPLPWWHHLVSGRRETIHRAGMSIRDRAIGEEEVDEDDLPEHIVDWPA